MRSPAQSSLEYLLLISGAILVSVVILLVVISTSGTGDSLLRNNLLGYQQNFLGNNGSPPPAPDIMPPVINSISFTPGDFKLTFNYDVSDNVGVSSIVLMKTDNGKLFNGASPQAGTLNKFYLPYFDNPLPGMISAPIIVNGNMQETGSFIDEGVGNGVQYFYSVRICDAANNCTVAGTRPGNSIPTSPKHPVPNGPLINISFGGAQEIIYHGDRTAPYPANDNCSAFDAPDLPLRAFRNQNNETIVIGSSAPDNYIWTLTNNDWSDPNNFVRECTAGPALPNHALPYTPYYALEWLSSPYILPNGVVYMIVHNEWHDPTHYSPVDFCYSNPSVSCTLYSSTLAVSADGGHHYTNVGNTVTNDHVTHATPRAWDPSFDPLGDPPNEGMTSQPNVLKKGNYFYMLNATIHSSGDIQRRGSCLTRTSDLSDPASWEFFQFQNIPAESTRILTATTTTGQDHSGLLMGSASSWNLDAYFTGSSRPVVTNAASNDDARGCDFVHGLSTYFVESIVYSDYLQKYVALMVDTGATCRFLFSVSPDLVRWSAPEILKDFTTETNAYGQTWPSNCHPEGPVYPSVLDSTSPSDNFETIDNDAYLYWMNWWPGSTGGSSVDEIRQRIQFDCPNGCTLP